MGATISRATRVTFEIISELYTAVASGFLGIVVLTYYGVRNNSFVGTVFVATVTATSLMYAFSAREKVAPSKNMIVVITGCDSGLGFSLVHHANDIGLTVLAGCLDVSSEGAKKLSSLKDGNVRIFELDLTNEDSVTSSVRFAKGVLKEDQENVLWAVINNAAVMVFGEFEWQTEKIIQHQIGVNLLGTMRFTNAFCPLLRKYKARLINVASHCAMSALPGVAVYGATKAGLRGFSTALRVEMAKYGVKVILFTPGSFVTQSNILAKQMDYTYEMRSAFSKEQEDFYGPYFMKYNSYLSMFALPKEPLKVDGPDIYEKFEDAILSEAPRSHYIVAPWRYTLYHTLFKISPTSIRDFFVRKFVRMPDYEPPDSSTAHSA